MEIIQLKIKEAEFVVFTPTAQRLGAAILYNMLAMSELFLVTTMIVDCKE